MCPFYLRYKCKKNVKCNLKKKPLQVRDVTRKYTAVTDGSAQNHKMFYKSMIQMCMFVWKCIIDIVVYNQRCYFYSDNREVWNVNSGEW